VIDEKDIYIYSSLPCADSCTRSCCNEHTKPNGDSHGEGDANSDCKGNCNKESNADKESASEEKEESHKAFTVTQVATPWFQSYG
jgi:hypothetical protein